VHPEDATRQQIMNTIEAFLSKDPAEPEQKRKQRMPARAAAQLAPLLLSNAGLQWPPAEAKAKVCCSVNSNIVSNRTASVASGALKDEIRPYAERASE
jgi:hypothetical protein